jgi:hemerythrin
MAYVEWSSDLNVNVKEIDLQHTRLVEMINSEAVMLSKSGREVQRAVIDQLLNGKSGPIESQPTEG